MGVGHGGAWAWGMGVHGPCGHGPAHNAPHVRKRETGMPEGVGPPPRTLALIITCVTLRGDGEYLINQARNPGTIFERSRADHLVKVGGRREGGRTRAYVVVWACPYLPHPTRPGPASLLDCLPAAVRAEHRRPSRALGDEAAAALRQDRRFGGGRLHPAGRPGAAPRLGPSPRRVGRRLASAGGALLASTSTALRHRCHPSTAAQLDSLRSRPGAQPHGLPRPRQVCVSAGGLLHPPLVRAALRVPAAGGRAEEGLRHALPAQRQPLRPVPALRRGEPLRGGDARIPQRAVPVGGGGRGGAPGRPRAARVGVPAHVEPALQRHGPARAAQPGRARAGGSARRARRPPPGGGHGGAVGARQHAALPGLRQQHHAQLGGAGVGADRAPGGARAQQQTRPRAPLPHRAVRALHEARGPGVARPGAGGPAAVAGADAHGAGAAGGRQPAPGRRPAAGRGGGGGAPGGDDDEEEEEAEDGVLPAGADAALRPGPDRLHPAAARGVRPRGARVPRCGAALLRLPGSGRGEGAAGAAQGGVLRAAGRAPAAGGERGAGAGVSAQREPAPVGGLLLGRHAGRQGDLLLVPGRAVAALADGYLDRGPRRQHLGFVSHAAGGCRHRALRPLQLEYILAQPVLPPPIRRHGPDGGAHLDARQRRGRGPQARSLQSLADGGAAAGKQQHRLHQRAHRHARLHRRPHQAGRHRPAPGLPGRSRRQVHAALALRLDAATALQLTADQIRKCVGPSALARNPILARRPAPNRSWPTGLDRTVVGAGLVLPGRMSTPLPQRSCSLA